MIYKEIPFKIYLKDGLAFCCMGLVMYNACLLYTSIVESKNGNLSVYPINALYDKCDITSERDMLISDCTKIYNTFTGKKEMAIDILDEYVCFEKIKDAL